jgi:hypothetical protein
VVALTTRPPSSDDVIPPLSQVRLLGRGPGLLSFRRSRVAYGGTLSARLGRLLCKGCLRFFCFFTPMVVRHVVSPAATALRLFPRSRAPPGRWEPPHATHWGAYLQFRCICTKRWQR